MDLRAALDGIDFYGNTSRQWIAAAIVLVITFGALAIVRRVAVGRFAAGAARTPSHLDDLLASLARRAHPLVLLLVAVVAAAATLELPIPIREGLRAVVVAVLLVQLAFWGNDAIAFFAIRARDRQGAEAKGTLTAMSFVGRLVLWSILSLLLLDNFGVQITALVATLGVGGIAVALAAQSVLGDLLAAISIYLDKPFAIGDFIIFDEFLGTVEYVGLRSSRIQSLSGEKVILSNSDLLKARIRNYAQMKSRRIVFTIGVAYGTPLDAIRSIPGIIREAVEEQSPVRFDRSHFASYGESSLTFETVYYVLDPDYGRYMDIQQAINLRIFERFETEGISFAHPMRTVALQDAAKWRTEALPEGAAKTGT